MSRRRLLMLEAQNTKGYFDGYKTDGSLATNVALLWFSFDKSNQFQIHRSYSIHRGFEASLANFDRIVYNIEPSSKLLPLGYDSNKKYNLKIKVLNKSIDEECDIENVNGNGVFTFLFKGLDVTKYSQSINIRDVDQGTEFIIPIEIGENLNNLCVEYVADTIDGQELDHYPCYILFEIYFEEITE